MVKDFKNWKVYAAGVGDLYNGADVLADGITRKNDETVKKYADSVPDAVKVLHDSYGLPSEDGALIGIVSIDGVVGANLEFAFGGIERDDDKVRRLAHNVAETISEDTGYDIIDLDDYFIDYDLFIPYDKADDFVKKYGRFDDVKAMMAFTDKYYDIFNTRLEELS